MMNNQIEILIVVDVEGALGTNNINKNVYMVDNRGNFLLPVFPHSYGEGTHELATSCEKGSLINWRVVPVDPTTKVAIFRFEGEAVPKIIDPHQLGENWTGKIAEDVHIPSKNQYSITLKVGPDGREMKFDPYLLVSPMILPTSK